MGLLCVELGGFSEEQISWGCCRAFDCGSIFCNAGDLRADDLTVVVTGGKRTQIGALAIYNSFECTASAVPETRIATKPTNGRLEIVVERRRYKTDRCGMVEITAPLVYYTPNKGFRGQDTAAVDYIFFAFTEGADTTNRRQSYTITVK